VPEMATGSATTADYRSVRVLCFRLIRQLPPTLTARLCD